MGCCVRRQQTKVFEEAMVLIGDAVRLDTAHSYAAAIDKYLQGIQRLLHVIKCGLPFSGWSCCKLERCARAAVLQHSISVTEKP